LIVALEDTSADVRAWAGLAVLRTQSDDPRLPAALQPLLGDADVRVRVAGAATLGRFNAAPDDAIQALSDGLLHSESLWATEAALALARLGQRAAAAAPALRTALWSRQPPNDAALDALATIGPDGVPVLAEMLTHSDPTLRACAAYFLGRMGPAARPAVPALQGALGDADEKVRRDVERALKRIGLS
jgi:HEAT repeat protein